MTWRNILYPKVGEKWFDTKSTVEVISLDYFKDIEVVMVVHENTKLSAHYMEEFISSFQPVKVDES